MRRLRVMIIDLVSLGRTRRTFGSLMNANLASLMPQAVAVWCAELGHQVQFVCYTGEGDLAATVLRDIDVLFISAFTRAASLADSKRPRTTAARRVARDGFTISRRTCASRRGCWRRNAVSPPWRSSRWRLALA